MFLSRGKMHRLGIIGISAIFLVIFIAISIANPEELKKYQKSDYKLSTSILA